MKDESLTNNIVTLYGRGWAIRRLSREFGVSRGRIKRILERHEKERQNGVGQLCVKTKAPSKLDAWKPYIEELLEKFIDPPITNRRILELIRQKGYEGGQTILRNYLFSVRGKKAPEVVHCVETAPGQRAYHDWSDYFIDFTLGESEKVTFFSLVLGYSRRQYVEVVEDKSQAVLLRTMINAFTWFDGVPHQIKSDNQRACVDRWELGRPVFNKTYLGFCTHYRFEPLAIRPGHPEENLKVERPFYYIEKNFLNGRTFRDRDDLKEQLAGWLTGVNDQRIHRTTGRKPIDMYAEELPYLQPIPAAGYDTSVIAYRVVNGESAIQWENYYYMVPRGYLYETCPVRVSESEITIYSPSCMFLVTHTLAKKGQKERYVGRKEYGKTKCTLDMKELTARLEAFGPVMQNYIEAVKQHNPTTWRHHWQRLIALKAHYEPADMLQAVGRALKYHVHEVSAVENFLRINATKKSEIYLTARKHSSNETDTN